jgi:hypothetical protein
MIKSVLIWLINVYINFAVLSLKTTNATRLYSNLDIPEARQLIVKLSGEESVPKIIDFLRNMQGTIEEQMFHNRRTLQDITEIRKDDIYVGVMYLFPCIPVIS